MKPKFSKAARRRLRAVSAATFALAICSAGNCVAVEPEGSPSRGASNDIALPRSSDSSNRSGSSASSVSSDSTGDSDLAIRLTFLVDDATLTSHDLEALTRLSRILLSLGIRRLEVEGHTDNVGGREHNRILAERRARAVAQALAERGFALSDIAQRGFGATRPVADNSTRIGRLHNRRAALIVPSL
jgi:outer membrane protein OmpA-like peptidoglycan-associated protein